MCSDRLYIIDDTILKCYILQNNSDIVNKFVKLSFNNSAISLITLEELNYTGWHDKWGYFLWNTYRSLLFDQVILNLLKVDYKKAAELRPIYYPSKNQIACCLLSAQVVTRKARLVTTDPDKYPALSGNFMEIWR